MSSTPAVEILFWIVVAMAILIFVLLIRLEKLRYARENLLKQKDIVFGFIHDIGEVFSGDDEHNLNALLKRLLFYALRTSKAGAGAIYLLDDSGKTLRAAVSSGTFVPLAGTLDGTSNRSFEDIEEFIRNYTVEVGEGLIGEVAARNNTVLIRDAERDPRVPRHDIQFLKVQSVLIVPMRFHGSVLGVLIVMNRVDGLAFNESDQDLLQAVADQASVSVHFAAMSRTIDEKRRLDYDLQVARKIQSALHPSDLPSFTDVEFGAFSLPAQEIGGDYYDVITLDPEHLGIAIGDVSGKGVSGALIMTNCRSVLRLTAANNMSPAAVLREVNTLISPDLGEDMFISMTYMILNHKTQELTVARAGHVFPLRYRSGEAVPDQLASKGMAIGLAPPEVFNSVLDEQTFHLNHNDLIVLYTDGISEARNENEQDFEQSTLEQAVGALWIDNLDAPAVAQAVEQKLLQFIGNIPQYDDMTLVAMRVI